MLPGLPSLGPVRPRISGLSCTGPTACVAVDRQGGYAFVRNSSGGPWTATRLD
jgi:hypothetical protein